MAENTITVKIKEEFEGMKQKHETFAANKEYKSAADKERTASLIKEADELLKVENLTTQQAIRLQSIIRQVADSLTKVVTHVDHVSEKLKELQNQQTTKEGELDKYEAKQDVIQKKGRINKETGEFTFFTTELNKQIKAGNITTTKGKQVQSYDTFAKHFKGGRADANYFKDPTAAQELYDNIEFERAQLNKDSKETIKNIRNLRKELENLNRAIKNQEKTDKQSGGKYQGYIGQVSESRTNVNNLLEDVKTQNKEKEISGKPTQQTAGTNLTAIDKQPTIIGKALKQFTLYAVAIRAAKSALREAVSTVKELDKYLTEQAMVTGKTREETYGLVKGYQALALEIGATTKEVASVATEYMKQGKSVAESMTLTEAAISAAKVARVSVGDSVNYLTTALNGFRLSANQAMAVSDKFAAVAASSATDYDELAIALSKVASQANLAGMSIDYTTALLTKGLETTREAPETMGTALKTIIARMREMTDYGKTLEDGVDFNNVETQLSYVGIALKNEQGELRSTQDVLDELGRKWDTLNKNQQAALAKALAGTRQQSRLIAMMDGYERVVELQDIAERSAGATAAQMGTYLEGMEAALKKINTSWETIVASFVNNEWIIGAVNAGSALLDLVNKLISDMWSFIPIITLITTHIVKVGGLKLQEHHFAKEQLKYEREKQKIEAKQLVNKTEQAILDDKALQKQQKAELKAAKLVKAEKVKTLEKLKQARLDEKDPIKQKELDSQIKTAKDEVKNAKQEINKIKTEQKFTQENITTNEKLLKIYKDQEQFLNDDTNAMEGLAASAKGYLNLIATPFKGIIEQFGRFKTAITSAGDAAKKAGKKQAGHSAATLPFIGWIAWAAIEGIALVGTVLGAIKQLAKWIMDLADTDQRAQDSVNELANEIYKLNEKANGLREVRNKFEDIDKKVIKTSEDLKEMNSLIDSAADKLSEDEKLMLSTKGSPEAKMAYLKEIEEGTRNKARETELAVLQLLKNNPNIIKDGWKDAGKNRALIKSGANSELSDQVDNLDINSEKARDVKKLTRNIIDNLSVEASIKYAEKNSQAMADLLDITSQYNGVLEDEDSSLIERVNSFERMRIALSGNQEALDAFNKAYSQWDFFTGMSDAALDFLDKTHLTNEEINKLYTGYDKLNKLLKEQNININADDYQSRLSQTLSEINSDFSNFEQVLENNFGDIINVTDKNGKEWNALVETIGSQFSTSILDMGQNMQKFHNNINGFYDTASKWNSMRESEKSDFIAAHEGLFKGKEGTDLLQALESGNFETIEQALKKSYSLDSTDGKINDREKALEDVIRTLEAERAKGEDKQDQAFIRQLEGYKKFLEDEENMFKASLETRLKQEQSQLNEYKDFLSEKEKAEKESLDKRKEAYQKYFDNIKEAEAEEDYEEKKDLLVSNISKLSSSTNADAVNKRQALEQQFKELEEERMKTLREKAQEQIMTNIDNEIKAISDKFDKLLESNQALLLAMKGDLKDPSKFLANQLSTTIAKGGTELELQSYLKNLQGVYGNVLGNDVFDKINVSRDTNNNLVLNVSGQEIMLSNQDQQSVFTAIQQALKSIGLS